MTLPPRDKRKSLPRLAARQAPCLNLTAAELAHWHDYLAMPSQEITPLARREQKIPSASPAPVPSAETPTICRMEADKLWMDLHGLTQAEAHAALSHALAMARHAGILRVEVVTGLGRHLPGGGVLRREVPRWLEAEPAIQSTRVLGGTVHVRLRRPEQLPHGGLR